MKDLIVWLITLYQKKAPTSLRDTCRFEPSCSQYTMMAVQKYGPFKGVVKGLIRISRCKPPNGGLDIP
jgi:putative membrane protein insertion efficiency factor